MEGNKSNNKALCIICGILTVFGLVATIISLVNGDSIHYIIGDISNLVVFALIGYYAIYGYRKPHGNLLKYIILIFAATFLLAIYSFVQIGYNPWRVVNFSIIIGLCCYISGRLHRVKQNIIFMFIVAIDLIVKDGIDIVVLKDAKVVGFTNLIIWIDICVAYFLRYKEHKEAGLMDAVKK